MKTRNVREEKQYFNNNTKKIIQYIVSKNLLNDRENNEEINEGIPELMEMYDCEQRKFTRSQRRTVNKHVNTRYKESCFF